MRLKSIELLTLYCNETMWIEDGNREENVKSFAEPLGRFVTQIMICIGKHTGGIREDF